MFASLRARQPGKPLHRILWWHVLHFLCFVWVAPCYRYRAWGIENVPPRGPVLLVSNHQSFLDPILVGLGAHHRQFYAMARSSLFRHPFFGGLIRSINAVPIERGASDMAAMRLCIDVLKQGHALLVFPEGTRTGNGTTGRFATGAMLLIKRSGATVVPVGIEGAFAVWPRWRKGPRLSGRIGVAYGEPIEAASLLALPADEATEHLRQTVERLRLGVAGRLDGRSEPNAVALR